MCKSKLNVNCLKELLNATETKAQNDWIVDRRGRKMEKSLLSKVLLHITQQKIQRKLDKKLKKEEKKLKKALKKKKRPKHEIVSCSPSEGLKIKIKIIKPQEKLMDHPLEQHSTT
ncbi:uncharacterized protein LOC129972175 [Argiope bruennichi]|uniref:Uncharacterized protein n=1 Tax=Argiope bruennichi TaxID=94029 RepID=A0A8T0F7I4_ARGBR|nr:uncharacterized protein LOC129972175 [Argiope bruennichi]KAF8787146.1 hypothetical protein HNY73_008773 [Argiope bruennichi]